MTPSPTWQTLGCPAPDALTRTRLALHHAAQPVAAPGATWLEPRPDHSHLALTWIEAGDDGHLVGPWVGRGPRVRSVLWPTLAQLGVEVDGQGEVPRRFDLAGSTCAAALTWVETHCRSLAGSLPPADLALPDHELPERAGGPGAPLAFDPDACAELTRWFENAAGLLAAWRVEHAGPAPVRLWPHHFDLATLWELAPDAADPEEAPSVNAGLSPGDDSYAMPYLYVTPWPAPQERDALPQLEGGGRWHHEDFFSAVLTANTLVAAGDGEAQSARARAFLASATAAALALIGPSPGAPVAPGPGPA